MRTFAFIVLLAAGLAHAAVADAPAGTITADVVNLRIEQGWELCALFASADGFPADFSKTVQHLRVPIHDGRAVCAFPGVKPGTYAISAMRDENGNGIPARDFFDLPKSGVGASNDAKGFFGPPKFEDARFDFKGGDLRLTINMVSASRSR